MRYNGQMLRCLSAITHEVIMRLFSVPPPTLLAGFLAVLIGYASSAAIIWQAAIVAGATTAQISGWMTALGLAMGFSTLALTLWYRVPVLTAWSTPGAALLVTGLQGLTLNEAIGVFMVTNALIVLCGVTGLFARLMRILLQQRCWPGFYYALVYRRLPAWMVSLRCAEVCCWSGWRRRLLRHVMP